MQTVITVSIDKDRHGMLHYPVKVFRGEESLPEYYESIVIHGPSELKLTPDRKHIWLYTSAEVEGRNRKP